MTSYPTDWTAWSELSDPERRKALADPDFWSALAEAQRAAFLDQADWQQLRQVPQAREAKLRNLISLQTAVEELGLSAVEIFWLMSTRQLPGWLVGSEWRFDRQDLGRWVDSQQGIEAVRQDVKAQIERHHAAQNAPSSPSGSGNHRITNG